MMKRLIERLMTFVHPLTGGYILAGLLLALALAACREGNVAEKLHLAREAAQAVFGVVCELPPDHVIREKIRDAVADATGLDTSRVCEDGLSSLLDRTAPGS